MDEAPRLYPNLNDETQFRSNKFKDYFIAEIRERETTIKKLSKYFSAFDYFDKVLIVLSAASGGISNISFSSIIRTSVGITSFSFAFSLTTEILKKTLKTTRNKKKNHNKIVMLARSKLKSIETLISQALINSGISHEDFTTFINEEEN